MVFIGCVWIKKHSKEILLLSLTVPMVVNFIIAKILSPRKRSN